MKPNIRFDRLLVAAALAVAAAMSLAPAVQAGPTPTACRAMKPGEEL